MDVQSGSSHLVSIGNNTDTMYPDDWKIVDIKHIFDVHNGSTPKSSVDAYWNGDISWITPADMVESKYIESSSRFITSEGFDSCNLTMADPGDIVISCRAPIGSINVVSRPMCTNQGCKLLKPKSKIDTSFYYYYLYSQKDVLNSLGRGTTFMELSTGDLNDYPVPLPDIENQQRIANFLDSKCSQLDDIIRYNNLIIDELSNLKQSIISEVVITGLNSNVSVKYSGVNWIGDIPESWGLTKVSNQYDVTLGKMLCTSPETPDSTEENYLCSANVKRNGIEGDIKTMWFTPKEKEEYLLKKGDLIVSEGGNAGTPMIYDGSRDPCYIQNAVHRVRAYDNQDIRNRFLYYWMSFAKDIGYVDLVCNKATIAHFTKKKLMEMPVVSIDLDTMSDIVHHLDSKCTQIDLEINYTSGLIDTMSDYKQSLIYEYVTGKKSVDMEAS